ncbi:MAG: radical SAM protein [Desulfovibrio sp.]|uniref:radical SAM protein n=1 Tax=Desulfovibrio sp. TaxID=885 RepID=UPI00135D6119|nr:radical SAM protein [Desulfovibrio sp.]MTJ93461.1 radical SAM protein [Desulfovibrio sp.]
MAAQHIEPHLVMADERGNIYDDPDLLMVCRRGAQWGLPRPDELIPLPEESEFFLLPGRQAVGLDPETGLIAPPDGEAQLAVAAFAAPGYTISAHPAYESGEKVPLLPLFAYGAVGYARGRFYICARRVDTEPRQIFSHISRGRIEQGARGLLRDYPKNRLIRHIMDNCVARYDCPAARNFALGRYEAPLPSSRSCNASCVGCISAQEKDSPIQATPQCRLAFTPSPEEIAEVMRIHSGRETRTPIYSFGQGCEGDPLMNPDLLVESVRQFRAGDGPGTVNCNTNASRTDAVIRLAEVGLTSMRVSLNSARAELYNRYYRPSGYSFDDVRASIREARSRGVWVSLNLLVFPGVTDTEEELDALAHLVGENGVSMIQWRNLNIDPEWYFKLMSGGEGQEKLELSPSMGLTSFMKRLKKLCPWLRYGYFNPYLGEKAELTAPMPGEWTMPAPRVREAAVPEDDTEDGEMDTVDMDAAESEAFRQE